MYMDKLIYELRYLLHLALNKIIYYTICAVSIIIITNFHQIIFSH